MPDDTHSPNPSARTPVELEADQAQRAQRERDLARADDINATYHECEALLRIVQSDLAKFQQTLATNQPLPTPASAVLPDAVTNTSVAAQVTPNLPLPVTSSEPSLSPPPQIIEVINPAASPLPSVAGASTQASASGGSFDPNARRDDHEPATFPWNDGPSGARTELLQSSAEQVRRAFELNTQSQLSLYERMLELLDAQNHRLGELDRKTSELSNQLKSLKNR